MVFSFQMRVLRTEFIPPFLTSTAEDGEKYCNCIPIIEFRIETPQEYNAPAVPQDYQIRPNLSVIIEKFTATFR